MQYTAISDIYNFVLKIQKKQKSGIRILDNPDTMRALFMSSLKYNSSRCLNITVFENEQQITNYNFSAKFDPFADGRPRWRAQRNEILAQQYISNPLLIKNRKSHMRAFFMIPTINPLTVLYGKGYVLLSSNEYDATNLKKGEYYVVTCNLTHI